MCHHLLRPGGGFFNKVAGTRGTRHAAICVSEGVPAAVAAVAGASRAIHRRGVIIVDGASPGGERRRRGLRVADQLMLLSARQRGGAAPSADNDMVL